VTVGGVVCPIIGLVSMNVTTIDLFRDFSTGGIDVHDKKIVTKAAKIILR